MSFIGDASEKVVLDAGCGTGYLSKEILNNAGAKRVIGVDISGEMIRIARENNLNESNLSFEVDNISTLESVAENSIDIIVSNYVLMDVPDLKGALKSFKRVLKTSGKVIFTILHPCFPLAGHKYNESEKIVNYTWETSYFENHVVSVPEFSKEFDSSFTVFHRSLGDYISLFINNGFSLKNFKEPVIQEVDKELINEEIYEFFRRSPLSAFFVFELTESNKHNTASY
jgi:ubiquinone/menaquinone biosynthesis C-methylase UbiE